MIEEREKPAPAEVLEPSTLFAPPVRREKAVARGVVAADKAADMIIRVGGALVIVAVLGIMAFLISEALPLFLKGKVTGTASYELPLSGKVSNLIAEDNKTLGMALYPDGTTIVFHLRTGIVLEGPAVDLGGRTITALGRTSDRRDFALGFADGTVSFGEMGFGVSVIPPSDVPTGTRRLDDRDETDGRNVYSKLPGDQYRKVSPEIRLHDPLPISASGSPIVALNYKVSGQAERKTRAMVAIDGSGVGYVSTAESRLNLLTGKVRTKVESTELPDLPAELAVSFLLMSEKGDNVYVVDRGGTVFRFNVMDVDDPFLAEVSRPLPEGVRFTAFDFLLGDQTIMAGGSDGSLDAYFKVERKDTDTRDGFSLVRTRRYPATGSHVVGINPSLRGKSFAAVHDDGSVLVLQATSKKEILDFVPPLGEAAGYHDVVLTPKMDGLLAIGADGIARLVEFSAPHPETTFATLFGEVWYEGYPEPSYTWQSSASTDDFEQKLSLVPLIFGTIKATVYSLLFAIPVALLAAVHTSEFVHRKVRAVVKPTMELMASLPSVVLGFVAALVLAPVVESWIAAVILAFAGFPLALMVAAHLWQMIPLRVQLRVQGVPKFLLIFVVVSLEVYAAYHLGPLFEQIFFAGDFKAWLNGTLGTAEPFLFLLLLPISYVTISFSLSVSLGRQVRDFLRTLPKFQAAAADLARFIFVLLSSMGLAFLCAKALGAAGIDPRGGFIDTYTQRNTFIISIAMGFAVIPIIYTLAEDALNAVPEHLRSASLGCGATPWQTALYVILPASVSGVFSAIMIGMGRAVGETMIVVMAAGNTPLMDWNIFNGLRALSATIAIELPEAVKDGTLYRVLFLAGLVLFAMTFVINTVAEIVRIHFRKRARQL